MSSSQVDGNIAQEGDGEMKSAQDRLLDALLSDNMEEFRKLIKHKDVKLTHEYDDHHYLTCLEIACRIPNGAKFVEVLLFEGKVKPYINFIKPEPIHITAKVGGYGAMAALLKHKNIDVNAVDSKGNTAFYYIARFYNKESVDSYKKCIELLLNHPNIDINKPNKMGYTPISQAVYYDCDIMVQLLFKHCSKKLDLDSTVAKGRTARNFLTEKYPEMILPPIKYHVSRVHQSELLVALQNHHIEVFRGLLRQVDTGGYPLFDPNAWYERPLNSTCLELACKDQCDKDFVEALLNAGADPNAVNKITSMVAIHVAAKELNYAALKILLEEKKTIVNAVDKNEWTALQHLHQAIQNLINELEEPLQVSHQLFQHPDDSQNLSECVKLLCEGLHINVEDLQIKAMLDNEKVIELFNILMERASNHVEQEDVPSKLFTYLRNKEGKYFITYFKDKLRENPELCHHVDTSESNFLHIAIENDLQDVVEVLLKSDINPNSPSKQYPPPLVRTAQKKNDAILKILLGAKKVDVNATDMKGDTALHHAVMAEDLESCITLLHHGADIEKRNVLGKAPLSLHGLQSLLDKSLDTKNNPREEDFEVIFDYTLLTAYKRESINKDPQALQCVAYQNHNEAVAVNVDNGTQNVPAEQDRLLNIQDAVNDRNNDIQSPHQISGNKCSSELRAETKLLHYISKNDKIYKDLLDHPIIGSFLQFKWDCVKIFFYSNLAFFVSYFIILNISIMYNPYAKLNSTNTSSLEDSLEVSATYTVFWILLLIVVILLTLREGFQCVMSPLDYIGNYENYLDLFILILTWTILAPLNSFVLSIFNVLVILFSSLELTFLIGRCPLFSLNITILLSVSKRYVIFLSTYIFVILAFSHCLYIVFNPDMQKSEVYPVLWAITRTVVFMTGEYDAQSLNFERMPVINIFVFLTFVFLISIVLLNLLIGLSVNDIRTTQEKSKVLCIKSRIQVIYEIENTVLQCYTRCKQCFPRSKCFENCFQFVFLFPTEKLSQVTTLPNNQGAIKGNMSTAGKLLALRPHEDILEKAVKMISSTQQQVAKTHKSQATWEKTIMEMKGIIEMLSTGTFQDNSKQ